MSPLVMGNESGPTVNNVIGHLFGQGWIARLDDHGGRVAKQLRGSGPLHGGGSD